MINWLDVPIYLHRCAVDFRKSINGLSVLVECEMKLSPFERALFVFGSRCRRKVKVLYWEETGFCLWYKRLEQERFKWPLSLSADVVHLNVEQLNWLLRGLDIVKMQPHHRCTFTQVS